jgi:hypothetical protein
MDSANLTVEQLEALLRHFKPQIAYLQSMLKRMDHQKFNPLDTLRLRTVYALDQMESLVQCLEGLAAQRAKHDALWNAQSKREFKRIWREQRNG